MECAAEPGWLLGASRPFSCYRGHPLSASYANVHPKNHHAHSCAACVRTLGSWVAFGQIDSTIGGMPWLGGGARAGMECPCAKAFEVCQFSQFNRRPKLGYETFRLRGNSPLPQAAHTNDVAPSCPYYSLLGSSSTS